MATKYNYQDYLQLPKDKRYEIISGDLYIVPSPHEIHQRIISNILYYLLSFVKKNKLGFIYSAPLDVLFSEADIVQPDIIFITSENKKIITNDNVRGTPDLIIEILSPNTGHRDLGIKKKLYEKNGVREYWIIDPKNETVDILTLKGNKFRGNKFHVKDAVPESCLLLSSSAVQGFRINIKDIFA
ncbi:MAG TPA: Uma2 family endonuclease [Candidatus Brocadiaceae bacterium]